MRKHKKQTKSSEIQNLETDATEIEKANTSENVKSNIEETIENQAEEEQTEVSEKAVSSNRIRVKKKVRIRQS